MLAGLCGTSTTARADEPSAPSSSAPPASSAPLTPRVELRYDLWVDLSATAALGTGIIVWTAVKGAVLPGTCRWCDGSPGEVNAVDDWFRRGLVRRDPGPAISISHVLAYGAAPVVGFALVSGAAFADRRGNEAAIDVLLSAEGGLAGMAMTEVLKPIFLRTRPRVHSIQDEDARAERMAEGDALLSFPSGHTTAAFAFMASAGTIATLRGYRAAPAIWIAGLMIGVATAYTRIAADAHYFTDTIAGAAVGTAVGAGVPLLFHRRVTGSQLTLPRWLDGATIATSSVPGGRVVGIIAPF